MRKIYIKEDSIRNIAKGNLLPRFLFDMVKNHNTSLGDSEAFPRSDGYPFDYTLLKKRYEEVCNEAEAFGLRDMSEDDLMSELSSLIRLCKKFEEPIRDSLERVCENALNKLFAIPPEMINISLKLVDKVKFKGAIRMRPESSEDVEYTFKDIADIDLSNKAVSKRRFINALIQGASYTYANIEGLYVDELDRINPELLRGYRMIRVINDYLLFTKKEVLSDDKPMQGSYVETHLGGSDTRTTIKVQGILFPLLLQEAIKGLFELFSAHGLPNDKTKAEYIVKKADFILAEPWDMRLGVGLWKSIFGVVEDTNMVPYVFSDLVNLPTDVFNSSVKEILSKTEKGMNIIDDLIKTAEYDSGYQEFTNRINAKNLDKSLIKDSYFNGADANGYELDSDSEDSVIEEDDYLDESHFNVNELITESQESKSISAAKKLVMQKLNYDEAQADEFIRVKLRGDIPNLRTPQGGKFILGVTRMFLDGNLKSAGIILRLNTTLKYVASDAHINEYDRNLNGMSAQDLIDKFANNVTADLENDQNELSSMSFNENNDYDIVKIDSFDQSRKYSKYTSWCVTHYEHMFESYTNNGSAQFYFCLRKGFEQVPMEETDGCPLDEYGLSMIAVCVDENGALKTCTCRWNHDNGGNDNIMDSKEISNLIGANFYDVFKPNGTWGETLRAVKGKIAKGIPFDMIFDAHGTFNNGMCAVTLGNRHNYIKRNGEFVSEKWFDWVSKKTNNGFGVVMLEDGMMNFIDINGKFLCKSNFDDAECFNDGFAAVSLNDKANFIDTEGNILTPDFWYDEAEDFTEGYGKVSVDGVWNFIGKDGKYIGDTWYDYVGHFKNGFAVVRINGKVNYIDQFGEILSKDMWFINGMTFYDPYITVVKKDYNAFNIITSNGELLFPNIWFEDANVNIVTGRCWVEKNGQTYYVDRFGNLLDRLGRTIDVSELEEL